MGEYQVEYRLEHHLEDGWLKAGFTLDRNGVVGDYKRNFENYRRGMRRCVKITRTPVEFDVIIREIK